VNKLEMADQDTLADGGPGGGGGDRYQVTIQAVDATDFEHVLQNNQGALFRMLKQSGTTASSEEEGPPVMSNLVFPSALDAQSVHNTVRSIEFRRSLIDAIGELRRARRIT
jgi:hypothetical protein